MLHTNSLDNIYYASLIHQWQKNSCYKSRNTAIMGLTHLIYQIADQFKTMHSEEDIISEGFIAAMNVCDTYTNGQFTKYAEELIKHHILEFLDKNNISYEPGAVNENYN